MNGAQRDGVLVVMLVAALVAILAVAFGVVLMGCGENVPGIGPSIRSAHPSQHEKLMWAIDVAGDALQREGLVDPALIVDLTVLDGYEFTLERVDEDMGLSVWGLNELVLSGKGLRCHDTIATQGQDPEALVPSGLSLAHELAHCAQAVLLMPDPMHEDRAIWDGVVPAVNAALRAVEL